MSQIKATFTGSVVAAPEQGRTANGAAKLEFPVYVNHAKKNKETGNYDKTGDVSKIRVTLWGDRLSADIRQGDLVEITATIIEKTFQKRDGTEGCQLQTDWVEYVTIKHRRDDTAYTKPVAQPFPNDDVPF